MNLTTFDPSSPEYIKINSFSEVEALILLNSHSSKAWMLRAVSNLKYGDVNKAKVLLRRGIKTINFQRRRRKIKSMEALMNLEAYHDSREILLATFEEALKYNDTRKIYIHMLELLINTEKNRDPDILEKFANLEYKYGDIERSLNLYEEILAKYPKRKDLKSVYIQVLKSQEQEEHANSLL